MPARQEAQGREPLGASGGAVEALARRLRSLPVPVIGRIEGGRVILDLRCLDDENAFLANFASLAVAEQSDALA